MFSFHSTAAIVVEQAFYTIIISEFTLVVSFLFPFHSFLHSLLILQENEKYLMRRTGLYDKDRSL